MNELDRFLLKIIGILLALCFIVGTLISVYARNHKKQEVIQQQEVIRQNNTQQKNNCVFLLDRKLLYCNKKDIYVSKQPATKSSNKCYKEEGEYICGDVVFQLIDEKIEIINKSEVFEDLDNLPLLPR